VRSTGSRHLLGNTLAGLFLGVGVSLLLCLYGVVSWSSTTPDVVVVVGIVVGLGIGLLPVRVFSPPTPPRVKAKSPSRY
jgi:hypothetical protein